MFLKCYKYIVNNPVDESKGFKKYIEDTKNLIFGEEQYTPLKLSREEKAFNNSVKIMRSGRKKLLSGSSGEKVKPSSGSNVEKLKQTTLSSSSESSRGEGLKIMTPINY